MRKPLHQTFWNSTHRPSLQLGIRCQKATLPTVKFSRRITNCWRRIHRRFSYERTEIGDFLTAICWLIPEGTKNIPSEPALLSRYFVFSQERDVRWFWRVVFLWKRTPLLPFCFDIYRSRKIICCRCRVFARDGNHCIHGCLVLTSTKKTECCGNKGGVILIWSMVFFHVFLFNYSPPMLRAMIQFDELFLFYLGSSTTA